MNRKILKIVAAILIIVLMVGVSFFLGDKLGVESMTVKRVTPTQAASAMMGDHFFSDYRENTLLISGTVSSVSKSGGTSVVTFKTDSSFKALCDFNNLPAAIHQGAAITALSEGGSAQRQPSAVLLKDCVLLN